MKRSWWGACFLVVASLGTACSKSATAPTPLPPLGPPQLTRLTVTGNVSLTAIGETTQLAVTAAFSDGTSKDVSRDTTWTSTEPSLITVSSSGLVTAVRLGATTILARYQTQVANVSVTATPPGTFLIQGSVMEPGEGPVVNFRVTDSASSISTQTIQDGRFFLDSFPSRRAHLRFEKDAYEPVELDATSDTMAGARVQQMIRFVAGETVTARRLAPSDLTYQVVAGVRCNSCRLVRVEVPAKGTLHIRLTWPQDCVVALGLWVEGRHIVPDLGSFYVDADVVVSQGEVIFYVDRVSPSSTICHVPFVLGTSLTG